MIERSLFKYILSIWAAAALGRIALGSTAALLSDALLGLLWLTSVVLLSMSVRFFIRAKSAGRRIEALCLFLMMAALLVQGSFSSDETIGITTAVFFSSLLVLACLYLRNQLSKRAA